jgi:ketosteroid isomerase-like protein
MTLEQRIAALEARAEIDRLITRYARAVDEDIDAELHAIYAEDAVSEIIPWSDKPAVGRAKVVASFRDYMSKFANRKRFIVNRVIDVTGDDTATGWANWFVMQAGAGESYVGWGSYDWQFRRNAGIWEITKMVITVDCMTTKDKGWADLESLVAAYPD